MPVIAAPAQILPGKKRELARGKKIEGQREKERFSGHVAAESARRQASFVVSAHTLALRLHEVLPYEGARVRIVDALPQMTVLQSCQSWEGEGDCGRQWRRGHPSSKAHTLARLGVNPLLRKGRGDSGYHYASI